MVRTAPTLVSLALLLCGSAWAQDNTLSTWGAVGTEVDVGDGWSTGLQQEFRHGVSEGTVEKLTTAIVAERGLGEHLELAGHYRVDVVDWDAEAQTLRHRMGFDASVPARLGKVKLSLRQRLQPELRPAEEDIFQMVLRTRAKAALKLEGASPYVSVEPYFIADGGGEFERLRGDVGVAIPVGQTGLDLSYRLDEPIAGAQELPHRHILTVRLTWKPELAELSTELSRGEQEEDWSEETALLVHDVPAD